MKNSKILTTEIAERFLDDNDSVDLSEFTSIEDAAAQALAKHEGFVIVTKDNDFLARALVRGHPPQIVQICLGNASTHRIASLLTNRMDDIEQFVEENKESVFLLRE